MYNSCMADFSAMFQALRDASDPVRAEGQKRFFKTGPGQYGEGDKFLGVTVPQTRALAKRFAAQAEPADVERLLKSPWHEARLLGVLILVEQFEKAPDESARKRIFDFYTAHLACCNNWDLIDLSCYKIIGAYLYNKKDRSLLRRLACSSDLWQQRAAVVSTMYMVKRGDFGLTLELAEKFCTHPHDLMHKACGWLLREVGKKNEVALCVFLDRHAAHMPRTMLRYAVERLSLAHKKKYMGK